jgi:hypothetical protein
LGRLENLAIEAHSVLYFFLLTLVERSDVAKGLVLAAILVLVGLGSAPVYSAKTTTGNTDISVKIPEVVVLSVKSSCSSTATSNDLVIKLMPSRAGTLSSCPNVVTVSTNTTGFQLLFRAGSADLVNTKDSKFKVPSTANTAPAKLAANTWGYSIPTANGAGHDTLGIPSAVLNAFDGSYVAKTDAAIANDKYAKAPTSDAIIKQLSLTGASVGSKVNLQDNQTTIYFAAAVDMDTQAGAYKTTIIYTAIGEAPPAP